MPRDGFEPPLDGLFAEYRAGLPDPEPSAAFMPELWSKIEARRSFAFRFKRFSQALITAAAAVCLLLGFLLSRPEATSSTYVEMLTADQSHDAPGDLDLTPAAYERN